MSSGTQKSFTVKAFWFSVFSAVFITALVSANFFAADISSALRFVSKEFILIFSVISTIFLVSFFFVRERRFQSLKYEFVNIVTHKFRTPLTYVTWSVENLKKNQTPEEKQESVTQVENAANRLLEMTDILIDMAHIQDGYAYVFKAESFREMVEKTLLQYAPKLREKEIKFDINVAQDIPLISIDVKRMEMVIKTLLENALHYTKKGGLVSIKVEMRGSKAVRFTITDSGIGISRADLRHIFSMFYRSRDATAQDTEGMGLGLYIANHIIRRHGGRIWADSKGKDKGATFAFEIPLKHGQ